MKTIISIFAAAFMSIAATAQNTSIFLNRYMQVKNALVNSDSKTASMQLDSLKAELEADAPFKTKDSLLNSVQKMAKETELEKQRIAFSDVSLEMWNLVKQSGSLDQDVYYDYCPMKKAYWLSNEAEIKNPYYGSKMLSCGSVKDKVLREK